MAGFHHMLFTNRSVSLAQEVIAMGGTSPIRAIRWSSSTGFGTRYTNPATSQNGVNDVAFSPNGNFIASTHGATPFVRAYPWSNSGFGAIYSNPSTLPNGTDFGGGAEVAFSPDNSCIAVANSTTPFVTAYPWSASGFGTKYANPATLPAGRGLGISFNPVDSSIAVAHATTPFVTAYPWSASGFGTKYANPATLPTSQGMAVTFNSSGNAVAVSMAVGNNPLGVYAWSASGFGTRYTNPAIMPPNTGNEVAFSTNSNSIAVVHPTAPFVTAYPWSSVSGFGTKYADPSPALSLGNNQPNNVAFSRGSDAIAISHPSNTPFLSVYNWSSVSGFSTRYANPATLPDFGTGAIAFF
jgi:hypothetical protein